MTKENIEHQEIENLPAETVQQDYAGESQEAHQDVNNEFGDETYNAELEDQGTAVAASQTSKIMGIIIGGIVIIAILAIIFN